MLDPVNSPRPKTAEVVESAQEDVLSAQAFRQSTGRIRSTNPSEHLNRGIKHRTNVAGVFPDVRSVERLIGAPRMEQDDEWHVGHRYFSKQSMRELTYPEPIGSPEPVPMRPYTEEAGPVD